jgi:hypothetical protein
MQFTFNSNDLAYCPAYMNENLIRVQEEIDLGKAEIVQRAENADGGRCTRPPSVFPYFIEG